MNRHRRARIILPLLGTLAFSLATPPAVVLAQSDAAATRANVDELLKGAARIRALAEENSQAARKWRDIEASARRNLGRTNDPIERKWWSEDMATSANRAEELENYARILMSQADADDARAVRLQSTPNAKN